MSTSLVRLFSSMRTATRIAAATSTTTITIIADADAIAVGGTPLLLLSLNLLQLFQPLLLLCHQLQFQLQPQLPNYNSSGHRSRHRSS